MIQYSLPDRLLLDRVENLMLTGAPATRLGHQRLTPPASHFAHQLSTALSETWNTAATSSRVLPATNAATARSRRASCAEGDNCRASPTSSLTHGPTTQNPYRFGSIAALAPTLADVPRGYGTRALRAQGRVGRAPEGSLGWLVAARLPGGP